MTYFPLSFENLPSWRSCSASDFFSFILSDLHIRSKDETALIHGWTLRCTYFKRSHLYGKLLTRLYFVIIIAGVLIAATYLAFSFTISIVNMAIDLISVLSITILF